MRYNLLQPGGPRVSVIGFGASALGNVFGDIPLSEGERAVHLAIDEGINFFDTSPYYGLTLSEQRLGAALEGRRDRVVLATKCGRYGASAFNFSAKAITQGFEESLRRLRTDYVDLLQVHDCEFGTVEQIVEETLPALEELRTAGKARLIGITGYQLENLRTIARQASERGIRLDSVLSYCRYNLANTTMERELRPFAQAEGLGLINASPLHMGLLTQAGAPAWHPATPEARAVCVRAAEFCTAQGVAIETLALRFCLDYSHVATTLVGMGTPEIVRANLRVLEGEEHTQLAHEVMEMLRAGGAETLWPSGLKQNWDPGTPVPEA
ncbi:hypothetical protein FTO74_03555 [Granulicella sp. WH15]|uniref:aldo/keto reductase n=1 Tax=Granulicella sp. WH15 TaxID=2602070 RepID=UPI001366DB35|nr:aldo/keto reductase [Granulicella sp. WH15]QHN02549.1 hypothetical protein FTO74_03555 [Granulicella sp. WH15]